MPLKKKKRKKPPMKKKRVFRKRVCKFCADKLPLVDYKDVQRLQRCVTEKGKIIPRRVTGSCSRHQRQLSVAVKRARQMALLPYAVL
jgi:small subunit ribosomal protein S18